MENVQVSKRRVVTLCLRILDETPENTELLTELTNMTIYQLETYYREIRDNPPIKSILETILKNQNSDIERR